MGRCERRLLKFAGWGTCACSPAEEIWCFPSATRHRLYQCSPGTLFVILFSVLALNISFLLIRFPNFSSDSSSVTGRLPQKYRHRRAVCPGGQHHPAEDGRHLWRSSGHLVQPPCSGRTTYRQLLRIVIERRERHLTDVTTTGSASPAHWSKTKAQDSTNSRRDSASQSPSPVSGSSRVEKSQDGSTA